MLLNKKSIIKEQKELVEDLEGLGDILVFLTENKRNSEVLPALKELGDLLIQLFELKKTDPKRFEDLMLAEEYWKVYKENKEEAQLRLSFTPERYLVTFSFLLNQLIRVFESSLKVENDEISRHASYQLVMFLAKVTEIEQADLFVKEILKKLFEFSRKSIELKISSVHASTYNWYIDIVFNKLGQKDGFRYDEYLNLFNSYFYENIKYLISQNQFELFKNLIGFLIDGVHVSSHEVNKLWDYSNLLMQQDMSAYRNVENLSKNINMLVDGIDDVYTTSQLKTWLDNFENFKNNIYPLLNKTNRIKANKLEKEIKDTARDCYLYKRLKSLIFKAGAWIVYERQRNEKAEQSRFIKEIWTHRQPEDAGASYAGSDIYPQSLLETVEFFFLSSVDDDVFFWDDHHGGELYVSQYFLLLLLKYLKDIRPSLKLDNQEQSEDTYPEIETFTLPFDNSSKLSSIKFEAEQLIPVAAGLKTSPLLKELSLDNDELIDKKLIPFLKRLITNAEEKIKTISISQPLKLDKINEFKKDIYESFIKSVTLRKMLDNKDKLEDKTPEKLKNKLLLIGFKPELLERGIFFEDWHIDYGDRAKHYGRSLGEGEDEHIVGEIIKALPTTKNKSIKDALSKINVSGNTIIFASYNYIYDQLENSGLFRAYWMENTNKEKEQNLQGWYMFGKKRIKVYNFHLKQAEMYFAIFDIDKVGKLVQHYPLAESDKEEYLYKNLLIKIEDLSTNTELMEQLLKTPPQWLLKYGNMEQQKQHLAQYITFHLGEKFEFIKEENPQGISYIEPAV